jgi:ATP-dependent Clp protease ATP-binding subunit ClpA
VRKYHNQILLELFDDEEHDVFFAVNNHFADLEYFLRSNKSPNYNFVYDQDLIDYISKVGFDETFGARPIKRAIQDKIEDLISEKILMMEIEENKEYVLKVENDEVIVSDKEEKPKKGRKKKE